MATFYVDPTWTGTKSGTFAQPFDTWASVSWSAGNEYLQKEGTTFTGAVIVGASGTSEAARIVLGTYDASTGLRVTDKSRRAKVNANGAQFGIHTNFAVRNFVSVEWLEVSNCRHATAAIGIYWPTGNGTDLRIIGCRVTDCLSTSTPNGNTNGIKAFSDRCKVLYNDVSDISDDGILVEGDGVEIAYNDVRRISQGSTFGDCIQVAAGAISSDNAWVHHNHCDHTSSDAKQCIVVNNVGFGGTGGIVEDNVCLAEPGAATTQGIYIGTPGVTVRRNRIVGGYKGIQTGDAAAGVRVHNNSVLMLSTRTGSRGVELGVNDAQAYNNTVISASPTIEAYGIEQNGNRSGTVMRNNCVVGWKFGLKVFDGSGYVENGNALYANQLPMANEAGTSRTPDASDVQSDPMTTSDGRPLPGSPLLTAGADLGLVRDIDGRQGRKFIGAYTAATLVEQVA